MSRPIRSRSAVLVVAVLAFPGLCRAERTPEAQQRSNKVVAQGFLAQLWDALEFLAERAGCSIDPNGGCAQAVDTKPPTNSVDAGCSSDPDGCTR
ncbi:MAG TPA: hypothetical protein VEG34_04755 [Thermoanaerobaculia bacterium]|nr:hypothetical protein [Thermoanaerobaculia bacterium]